MIDVDAAVKWLLFVSAMCSALIAGWLAYENHTHTETIAELTTTNAELAYYATIGYDSLQVVVDRLREIQREGMTAALRRGSVAADSILRLDE